MDVFVRYNGSDCLALLCQPRLFFLVESRSQLVVHRAVVFVQPACLFVGEQMTEQGSGVDGAERHCLEAEVGAEHAFACGDREHQVFRADAVAAFLVDSRLVGSEHSCLQAYRVFVHADALRSFVHVEEMSYAVPCAVQEVHAVLPDGHACQYV